MFVNEMNWEDCKKYYQGCWIKVRECGERMYQIKEVGPAETYLSSPSRGENDEDANICINMQVGYTIDYIIPKKTTFQFGEYAIILERVPARMWKKGMDVKNTQFSQLNHNSSWIKAQIDFPVIEGFVNKPSYYTFEDTLKNFTDENSTLQSAALSPRVSLSKLGNVFIDTIFVGRLSTTTKTLKFKKIYQDDLAPLFTGCKLSPI